MCSCASGDSPTCTVVSTLSPCSAALEHRLDAAAHFGVEAVARDVDERREEATVAVAAQEQLAAHALLQAEDARSPVRSSSASLDWNSSSRGRVSRMWRSALPLWLVGVRPGLLHHVVVALAHQRDFPRTAVVGAGGVQAEEALLGDRLALGVELEHADVIHVAGAMHGRARIGLGQDQRVDRTRLRHVVRGERLQRARLAPVLAAQQPRPDSSTARSTSSPPCFDDFVFAIAEEGEVVVGRPAQEFLRFGAAGVGTPASCAWRDRRRSRASARASPPSRRRSRARRPARAWIVLCDAVHRLGRLPVDLQVDERFGRALADAERACRPCRAGSGRPDVPARARRCPVRPAPSSPSRPGTACRR